AAATVAGVGDEGCDHRVVARLRGGDRGAVGDAVAVDHDLAAEVGAVDRELHHAGRHRVVVGDHRGGEADQLPVVGRVGRGGDHRGGGHDRHARDHGVLHLVGGAGLVVGVTDVLGLHLVGAGLEV